MSLGGARFHPSTVCRNVFRNGNENAATYCWGLGLLFNGLWRYMGPDRFLSTAGLGLGISDLRFVICGVIISKFMSFGITRVE